MVSSFYVEDEKHVIVLKLVGTTEKGVQYVVPVTVKAKPKCQTCGHVNKATSKFCCDCGTSLVIL
jgi:tRNA(Ile2) C34 agmatinyltransferase TiaS